MTSLSNQQTQLEAQLKSLETTQKKEINILEPTKEVFLPSNRMKKDYLKAEEDQKRKIAEKVLWNLSIKNQKVEHCQLKMPYQVIANLPKNATFSQLRALVDAVGTRIREYKGYVYIPNLDFVKYFF